MNIDFQGKSGIVTGAAHGFGRAIAQGFADRGATAIIPIRRNGRPWKEDCPAARARNEILRASRHFGRVREVPQVDHR